MSDNTDVWLIVPMHNEGSVINRVVSDAIRTFPRIVCVDDGSFDDSAEQAHRAGAYVVKHPVNLGQGAALQTGVEFARSHPDAKYFVTFDADGQHRVEDAQRMIDRLRNEEIDIVVGTRFAREEDRKGVPLLKRIVLKTAVTLSPRNRRLGLSDTHNGLRAFNRSIAQQLDISSNGMAHAEEIIAMAAHFKWRITEEPVRIVYTDYSRGKGQSLLNGVNILFESVVHNGWRR